MLPTFDDEKSRIAEQGGYASRLARRQDIASAQSICPSKLSVFAMSR